METERMIYLVTEYASGGEIFGKEFPSVSIVEMLCLLLCCVCFSVQSTTGLSDILKGCVNIVKGTSKLLLVNDLVFTQIFHSSK